MIVRRSRVKGVTMELVSDFALSLLGLGVIAGLVALFQQPTPWGLPDVLYWTVGVGLVVGTGLSLGLLSRKIRERGSGPSESGHSD